MKSRYYITVNLQFDVISALKEKGYNIILRKEQLIADGVIQTHIMGKYSTTLQIAELSAW